MDEKYLYFNIRKVVAMSDKLILANGSEINIKEGGSLSSIGVVSSTKEEMLSVWDLLTKENLKNVQLKNNDDVIIAKYSNLILENEISKEQEDGSIFTYFRLREKTEVEILKEEVDALKSSMVINDGAILELGTVINDIVEKGSL